MRGQRRGGQPSIGAAWRNPRGIIWRSDPPSGDPVRCGIDRVSGGGWRRRHASRRHDAPRREASGHVTHAARGGGGGNARDFATDLCGRLIADLKRVTRLSIYSSTYLFTFYLFMVVIHFSPCGF